MASAEREARLQAIEARLRGEPSASEKEELEKQEKINAKKRAEDNWVPPGEKVDNEMKRSFARLLDRGIIRDNGYRQALICVETLLKIADNILNDQGNDPKYRTLKASNVTIRNKILNCKGGHEYLVALGFRTRTVEFAMTYTLEPKLKRMHELRLGRDILADHIPDLQKRVENLKVSQTAHQSEEAIRKAKALAEIEADRDIVKTRVERERRLRDYRATVDREAQQRKKDEAVLVNYNTRRGEANIRELPEEEEKEDKVVQGEGEEGGLGSVAEEEDVMGQGGGQVGETGTRTAREGAERGSDDDDSEDENYDPYLGQGRRLGGP